MPRKWQSKTLLDKALEIFGTKNLPKKNVQICLRSLERIAREKKEREKKENRVKNIPNL